MPETHGLRDAATCAFALAFCGIAHAQISSTLDYVPTATETVLNTDFAGGVFIFRNVTIPAGLTVRGTGSNPMVWIVTERMTIDGTLSVDGDDGTRVDTLGGAQFPTPGGTGNCTGGGGGQGSPNSADRSGAGENGFGPFQVPGMGGVGGSWYCLPGNGTGAGGGGGTFATRGDPFYDLGTTFAQLSGTGGSVSASVAGGPPGPLAFTDSDANNDFLGVGYDFDARRFLVGELTTLRGGQGGGGGGDKAPVCAITDPGFVNDEKGGGGGAGGGALLIYAIGGIEIGAQGRVSSNGGHGGGGEQGGSNNRGGGGGGGSGGMIVMGSPFEIVLHTHGETFSNGDFDFSVSADGGVSLQGAFQGQPVLGKYGTDFDVNFYTSRATGGFGGLGVVQFVTPVGHNTDGTNTHFDDFIRIVDANGQDLVGADKQRYLSWRGYVDGTGTRVDDFGNPVTNALGTGGDIRPAPKLLPLLGIQ